MKKVAFTLFEVLVSLVILSIVLIGVQRLYVDDGAIPTYYELQKIENQYIQNNTITQTENIKFRTH